jgi:transcription elongation factor GreA
MSEALVKNVQNMLNEEKWTRATLSNYSTTQFKELDALLKSARENNAIEEVKAICEEQLVHTKNSIIALYLSGMIALSRQIIDDSALVNLVTIFIDNHKWNIVQYLCERILDYGESKYALRMLAECYQNANNESGLIQTWERLIKVDFDEAEIVKALAEHYEKIDSEIAIEMYKKALHRYVSKKIFSTAREIWSKLVASIPDEIEFFLHVQRRVNKNISADRAAILLLELFEKHKSLGNIDICIDLLKIILDIDEKDSLARKELVDCYRKKYENHSQLDEFIRLSNLTQSWRSVHEAVADFEKHVSFDTGNYVFHRTWGVGRISSVKGDEITIDFAKKRNHSMSLKMALNALQTLGKNHIWVLKATANKEKLHEKVKKNPAWALKTIIRSYDNLCDVRNIKNELVPSILSAGEWTSWSSKARTILKTDPCFGVSPDNIDVFTVRDHSVSLEEKLYNEFKAAKGFFDRVSAIRAFVNSKDIEPDSEYFTEMVNYFANYLKSWNQVNEQIIASYLLVKDMYTKFPHLGSSIQITFSELYEQIEDLEPVFSALKDTELKLDFLKHIKLFINNWQDVYVRLFPIALMPQIINSLEKEGYEANLISMVIRCNGNYREYKEAVVWIFKNLREKPWFERTGLSTEKLIINLVNVLQATFREIENHRDTVENKKINRQIQVILFKEAFLDTFIQQADEDTITRIYTLVEDVKDLDPAEKMRLRNSILKLFPKFKFYGDEERSVLQKGLIVTAAKMQEKQKLLQHILEVEVPENSKEIGSAIALGDLRENAEYKAAKEKQELLNTTVSKLKDELEKAQVFDPSTVNITRVSFGTTVTITDNTKNETLTYTILGPWESDPENMILSYLSPFGSSLLNKKAGETFDFTIGDETSNFTINKIVATQI